MSLQQPSLQAFGNLINGQFKGPQTPAISKSRFVPIKKLPYVGENWANGIPSGNLLHIAIENGPIEIVDLPWFTHW